MSVPTSIPTPQLQASPITDLDASPLLNLGFLGNASMLLAFGLTIYAIVAGIIGASRRDARLQTSSRLASVAIFLAITSAVFVLETALINADFSLMYVATTGSATAPLWVKIVSLWASLDGSILLWAWLLSGYAAVVALFAKNTMLRPWALVILNGVILFFVYVIVFLFSKDANGTIIATNPFELNPSGEFIGPGPNNLLQNHWMMAVHPVLMYLGFVGLTVPFAFAMAALISNRPGTEWMQQTRLWTLTGWGFLTAAIIAGGWWSYEVLGWGGFWAWDPVENVSFMPWLTATAFLHSVQVQERRRMLKAWNILLIVLTFALTILGTFLTRAGVLSSVHAFGEGPVGPAFLAFFLVVIISAFGLLVLRWRNVRDNAEVDAPISREGAYLLGNVFFLAMTFAILLGTLFPILVEAFSGEKTTVGAPFFNQISVPMWLGIFWLMGIGPLLPWRKAKNQSVWRNLMLMSIAGVVLANIGYVAGVRKIYPLLTIALAGYNLMSLVLLLAGALLLRAQQSNRSILHVFGRYAHENRRRFGSMVVHFAVIILALGVAGASAYRVDEQLRVDLNGATTFRTYELRFVDRFMEQDPSKIEGGAVVEVWQDDKQLTTLRPSMRIFRHGNTEMQQPVSNPAVLYRWQHDLYLTLAGGIDPSEDYVVLRIIQSPFIIWIWLGGGLMALGTLYCLLPNRRRNRQAKPARPTSSEALA